MPKVFERFYQWAEAFGGRLRVLVPVFILLVAWAVRLREGETVQAMQRWVFDSYQRLKPRPYQDAPVRIIDIDDESLARLGQWQWPRTMMGDVVQRLAQLGASAIAFDIVFSEPDRTSPRHALQLWSGFDMSKACRREVGALPDHDQVLAQSINGAPVVLGFVLTDYDNESIPVVKATMTAAGQFPLAYVPEFLGAVKNLPQLENAAPGNGSFDTTADSDGIIRRVPMVFRIGTRLIPSLASEAIRLARKAPAIAVTASGARPDESVFMRPGLLSVRIGDLEAPTDANGRVWIYYTKPAPERTIPIWKIFEQDFDPRALKGRVVFIGTSAAGLRDLRATPLNPVAPGVEIHAQLAEQVFLQRFLTRPDWAKAAEVLYLLSIGACLIWLLERRGAGWGTELAGAAVLAAGAASWLAFTRWRLLIDPLFPTLTISAVYVSSALISHARGEAERHRVRAAFAHYVSPAQVERLAARPDQVRLSGETRRMTFHFCDIEGFTTVSEFYDPRRLVGFLNDFLTPLGEIVLNYQGTIDKFVGDCIVAFWNAPLNDPDHAKNACLAALEMHARLKIFNEERRIRHEQEGRNFVPVRLRTGLNTGDGIVGNMGSASRFGYSVIGDDVNFAARLELANKLYGTHLMASETTFTAARDAVEGRELGKVRYAGRAPVRVFEVLAKKGDLMEQWKSALRLYEDALKNYDARNFEAARNGFQEVLRLFPKDGPSTRYAALAAQYIAAPPPADWDNVFNLNAKSIF